MHILEIPDHISESIPVAGGRSMEPGAKYICTNAFTGELLRSPWRVLIKDQMWALRLLLVAHPFAAEDFISETNWNNKDIWMIRGGGYGDLLMMTPTILELKKKWPGARIHVACGQQYHGIFDKSLGVIEELLPVPLKEYLKITTTIIPFEETIEGTPDGETMHIADIFADAFEIILEDRRPHYVVYPEEKKWAQERFPRTDKKRVGVQFMAGALYRSYPAMGKVIQGLAKEAEVFIFGTPGQLSLNGLPNTTNLSEMKLTFRESAAALATCDSCVAPDSAFTHLCSALDIPCVGLYGPISSLLRVSGGKARPIVGTAPCAPCFFTAEHPTDFPAGMPCTEKGRCVAMESIDSDLVVSSALL